MTEEILSYLWKFQRFNKQELQTTEGSNLSIYNQGYINYNSGPDFSDAHIRIDNLEWHGPIELHVNSSDWDKHKHGTDEAFQNVILHVVWNHDKEIVAGNLKIPVLELRGKVPKSLIDNAIELLSNLRDIPCGNIYSEWDSMHSQSVFESLAANRLERKSQEIMMEMMEVKGNWEEAFFRTLSANMGFKVNKDPFYQLAKMLGHGLIAKCSTTPLRTEALLMGVAGFLNRSLKDSYFIQLKREFEFLKRKHRLSGATNTTWKFSRMRPANFPTIRIAQLAAIYTKYPFLFRSIVEAESIDQLRVIFESKANEYWQTHYQFGPESPKRSTILGEAAIDLILINSVVPFLFCYGQQNGLTIYQERSLNFLEAIKGEDNKITRKWKGLGAALPNALISQGSLELYQKCCLHRKCMHCNIGARVLSRTPCE